MTSLYLVFVRGASRGLQARGAQAPSGAIGLDLVILTY
jgi:hypothetical protein